MTKGIVFVFYDYFYDVCSRTYRTIVGKRYEGIAYWRYSSGESTTNGTITDINGVFTLSNSKGCHVGNFLRRMKPQDIPVNGSSYRCGMEEEAEMLGKVVVVDLAHRKVNLTGAVSTASSREIESRPE